jgi:hypothetical protein
MGMNQGRYLPREWEESEARRRERRQRSHDPFGRSPSRRSRLVVGTILGLGAVALVVYAFLGWLGIITVPGINA